MRPVSLRHLFGALVLFSVFLPPLSAQNTVGEVSFPNSGLPAAQPAFLHGLAQLHNFEYDDAAVAFRKAQEMDPGFAMAYWGEAMTKNHPLWDQQDLPAARGILERLGPAQEARAAQAATEREKAYLRAVEILYGEGTKHERDLRYAAAMARVHEKYPDDIDAAAFYALALLGTPENGRHIPTYMRAAAILEDLFWTHPQHPGAAHYLIHSFDDPTHAPLGLRAARAYSKIAPEASHAQHMTSHIFLALGLWNDVVHANETAIAVVNRQRQAAGKPLTSCGHYNFWLEYGYLQQGRLAGAKRILSACRIQAEQQAGSTHAHGAVDPDSSAVGSYVQMRSRYLMDAAEWNSDVVGWGVKTSTPMAAFSFDFATAYAAAQRGDVSAARAEWKKMEDESRSLGAFFDQDGYPAGHWWRKVPGIAMEQIRALLLAREGKGDAAVALLRKVSAEEQSLPYAFGPPVVDKPTSELLGELLLEQKQPAEARKAFEESLARTPRRVPSLLGLSRAARAMGDQAAASQAEAELGEILHGADHPFGETASGVAPH